MFRTPDSVKHASSASGSLLSRAAAQAGRQDWWRQWLARHLPTELSPHLTGVVEREHTLVVFAESAAWSARLRYVMQELDALIKQAQPTIQQVSVRVMPKA